MCDISHMAKKLIVVEFLPAVFMPIGKRCLIHYKMYVQVIRVYVQRIYHLVFGLIVLNDLRCVLCRLFR